MIFKRKRPEVIDKEEDRTCLHCGATNKTIVEPLVRIADKKYSCPNHIRKSYCLIIIDNIKDSIISVEKSWKRCKVLDISSLALGIVVIGWNTYKMLIGAFPNPILNTIVGLLTGALIPMQVQVFKYYLDLGKTPGTEKLKEILKEHEEDYANMCKEEEVVEMEEITIETEE